MKVLFTGGGTGGHLYPAIAIADALPAGTNVTFVGTADRMEATIVPKAGYPLETVRSMPFAKKPLAALRSAVANLIGIAQSLRLVARLRPDFVIATGGYVCFPVVAAARILRALRVVRAPIALLEPNATPGLTNRMLAPFVDEVWGAYADVPSAFRGKYVHTGVPVRRSLFAAHPRAEAAQRLGVDPNRRLLLTMGGSLGARSINNAVLGLTAIPAGWQVLLVSGDRDAAAAKSTGTADGVRVVPYLDDPADAFSLADIVMARAGASTVAELVALGLASILVPYPHHADEHQVANARALERLGSAIMVRDAELTPARLTELLSDDSRLVALQGAAKKTAGSDTITTILARIAALSARKKRE